MNKKLPIMCIKLTLKQRLKLLFKKRLWLTICLQNVDVSYAAFNVENFVLTLTKLNVEDLQGQKCDWAVLDELKGSNELNGNL